MANLILNPSFETDSNADGLADNWTVSKTVSGTVTTSRVAGLFGSYAQRLAYESASDSAKYLYIASTLTTADSVASGSILSGGVWTRVLNTGTFDVFARIYWYTNTPTYLTSTILTNLPKTGDWFFYPFFVVAPATATRLVFQVWANSVDTGDSVTLDVDGAYLSPDANFDYYGKYPVIGKGAVLL